MHCQSISLLPLPPPHLGIDFLHHKNKDKAIKQRGGEGAWYLKYVSGLDVFLFDTGTYFYHSGKLYFIFSAQDIIYLKGRVTQQKRDSQRKSYLLPTLSKWPPKARASQAKAKSLELHPGLPCRWQGPIWTILHYSVEHSSRELDPK